jgi:cell division inhibitor SulA/protein ImuA
MNGSLEALLAGADVWRARGGGMAAAGATCRPSGWPRLDAELPGGGWPLGTLIELLLPEAGIGEITLLLPVLRGLAAESQPHARHWFAWITPPHAPYPPALAQGGIPAHRLLLVSAGQTEDRLWAVEQALQSGHCAAVLAWLDRVDDRWLRRLKLAAESGQTLTVLFRPLRQQAGGSPASLRLVLEPGVAGLDLSVLKRRGAGPVRVHDALGA